jgi:hypothetical protein
LFVSQLQVLPAQFVLGLVLPNIKPGRLKDLQIVVMGAQATHDELKKRGVNVTDVKQQV